MPIMLLNHFKMPEYFPILLTYHYAQNYTDIIPGPLAYTMWLHGLHNVARQCGWASQTMWLLGPYDVTALSTPCACGCMA